MPNVSINCGRCATRRSVWVAALLAVLLPNVGRGDVGQVTLGRARFTVVTPTCVRLEYAPAGRFLDEPTWFAVNRSARFDGATIRRQDKTLDIDTGPIRLTYRDDGRPFSPENLSAVIKRGDGIVVWRPGDKNPGNLGGTITTVDRVVRAVPLGEGVVSRDGWYVLDDSATGLLAGDWPSSRPNAEDKNLDWYLFGYGHDYRAALQSLTTIGGPVPLPRKYTLGLWYSRYWSFTSDAFKAIVREYEEHGFPLDVMVMDMGWHLNAVPPGTKGRVDTWTGYTWDKNLISDPPALLKWMKEQGLHVTLNDHPAAGVQPHEAMYGDFMRAMGRDAKSGDTIPFDAGSKKYLDTFYALTHTPRENEGVDFWWLDWQQYPKTRSIPDLDNLRILNWYNFNHTARDGKRGQSFSRWAGWGDHRYPIQFSGDADTGWPMLAFEVPFTSTAGNVGAFFWSHDIGGHQGGRNEESYTRWCQFGALSAALRSHSTQDATTDRRPWNYPRWAEDSMRISFRLRSQLMPYIYSAVRQSTVDSVPFTRPLYLDHPTMEQAHHNGQEYRFGDDLLIAPIASPGVGPGRVAAQAVWFPPHVDGTAADWFDFFTGEKFSSGESAVATAPIDQFPLYVRGGVPLAMQPYTNRPGTAPLATLVVRCYPGRENVTGTASVYEDDGVTTGYQRGEHAITPLSYVRRGENVTVTIGATQGDYAGRVKERAIVIELPNTEPGATADSGTIAYDDATRTTRIELPAAPTDAPRTVTVRVTETPPQRVADAAVEAKLNQLLGRPLNEWQAANPKPSPEMLRMIAAVRGVAVLPVNQHPYGLGHDVAMTYLHNHHTRPDRLTLAPADRPEAKVVLPITPGQTIGPNPRELKSPLRFNRAVDVSGLPGGLPPLRVEMPDAVPLSADLAMKAKASASSGKAAPAIDGSIDGWPGDQNREWVTQRQRTDAWLKLDWDQPTRMSRVLLYDRPNANDHVLAGRLEFSDGTAIDVGPLPNDGQSPGVVTFPEKTCTWVRFTVTDAAKRTENIGLSEIVMTERP